MINAYITFNGNCREAMTFYKECLGGKLSLQTVGETPMSSVMPKQMKNCILHATLSSKNFVLMGSDMVNEKGLLKGNAITLVLHCKTEKEIKQLYASLSIGGRKIDPLQMNHHGHLIGTVTDKYDLCWMLYFDAEKRNQKQKTVN